MSPTGVPLNPQPDPPDLMRLAAWRRRALTSGHKHERRTRERHLSEFPCYGSYGELDVSEFAVTCHFCGREYRSLGAHIWMIHGLTADDYRRELGIHPRQPLDCHARTRRRAEEGRQRPAEHLAEMRKLAQTPETQSRRGATFKKHLAEGRIENPGCHGLPAAFTDGSAQRRVKELWAEDGEWAEKRRAAGRVSRGGTVKYVCAVCGAAGTTYRSHKRVACEKAECIRVVKVRTAQANGSRRSRQPDRRLSISA